MGINKTNSFRIFFENGIYESVLKEIIASQQLFPAGLNYLQPYANKLITGFKKNLPNDNNRWTLYASITTDLAHVHYKADIVGWKNKKELGEQEIVGLNDHIKRLQPGEKSVDQGMGVNLITLTNLQKLPEPIPVNRFYKIKGGTALKPRTQAGGWSYVYPYEFQNEKEYILKSVLEDDLEKDVKQSLNNSSEARRARLELAPNFPEKLSVVSTGFRRNPDVIAEALSRANGKCQLCRSDAPFMKAADGSPYLEVHHWISLAEGGEDTIENATALCPNCHKEAHFGQSREFIKVNKKLPD